MSHECFSWIKQATVLFPSRDNSCSSNACGAFWDARFFRPGVPGCRSGFWAAMCCSTVPPAGGPIAPAKTVPPGWTIFAGGHSQLLLLFSTFPHSITGMWWTGSDPHLFFSFSSSALSFRLVLSSRPLAVTGQKISYCWSLLPCLWHSLSRQN